MVLGAYTILNTVGLLVGLPITISSQNVEPTYPINNNITYFTDFSSGLSDEDFIILEFENSISNITNVVGNLTLDVYYNNRYVFEATATYKENYIIYGYKQTVTIPDYANNFSLYLDFTTVDLGANSYKLKNAYIATWTNALGTMGGDSVISSITSGLGLMGDITTNFKNGFSALIWNSEKNSLTTFGNFALIFLGVSITFAIVKLCLNLIRSKTGA